MPKRTAHLILAGLFFSAAVGCVERRVEIPNDSVQNETRPATTTRVIEVHKPMAVGFLPMVTQADVNADESLRSALEHLAYAIDDMTKCLRPEGISVQTVRAELLIFQDATRREEVPLRGRSDENVGCYLVEPNRPPKIIRTTTGPSSLVVLCPAAASVYFGIPKCCPRGFRCCFDGRVLDQADTCER